MSDEWIEEPLSDAILVGIDTGGTRTTVEVHDPSGSLGHHSYEVAETLSGSLTPAEYPRTLRRLLTGVETYLAQTGVSDRPVYVFASAAGFAPSVRDAFADAIEAVVPTVMGGAVRAMGVANDAPALLLGHDADGIVIAGTGSNVLVRSKDGRFYQIGGHEWVASDYGSGFWIGLRAIRRAYRDHEDGVDSVLLQRLIQLFGIPAGDEDRFIARLRDLSIADEFMKPKVARFAPAVCSAAERGDTMAQHIVKTEAEDLADVMAGALRRLFSQQELAEGIDLVQCGGLLTNDYYRGAFESEVEMRLRSGFDQHASLRWRRVTTGAAAALSLAERIQQPAEDLMRIDSAFRPLVVRFG